MSEEERAKLDALLDHIYEHGTTSEGVRLRAEALCDAARKSYAKTRAEAVAYTCRQLEEGPTSRNKGTKVHYGKQELRELLDFIYGGVPKNDSERLV